MGQKFDQFVSNKSNQITSAMGQQRLWGSVVGQHPSVCTEVWGSSGFGKTPYRASNGAMKWSNLGGRKYYQSYICWFHLLLKQYYLYLKKFVLTTLITLILSSFNIIIKPIFRWSLIKLKQRLSKIFQWHSIRMKVFEGFCQHDTLLWRFLKFHMTKTSACFFKYFF